MDREKLVGWIKDKRTSINRRRLYFTMLGVCGTKDDIALLEDLIRSDSRKKQAGLDALIACYLNLKGEAGVDLIEETFIADKDADYIDVLHAVTALRFHGTEVEIVSKKRIVKAVRQLLERPKYADMVIPDLARWEDWSSMETMVKLFKEADPESNSWLRVPVITYLRACPKPEAAAYIEELQKIDPEAVERADFFLGFDEEEDEDDEESNPPLPDKTSSNEASQKNPADGAYVVKKIPVNVADEPAGVGKLTGLNAQPNSPPGTFVSTGADSMSAQPTPVVAQAVPAPVATPVVAKVPDLTWPIVFIPMAISILIFLLLWSVVNGWFERLIF